MQHDVIMPALGMAQDTGLIVAWHKQPGDAVKAGDILMEVETDKSTMEVEAGHDGYVAALNAEAGQEVPVGDVIAIITAEKPQAPTQRKAETKAAAPAPKPEPEREPARTKAAAPAARPAARSVPVASDGRILASPKARRLARDRGIDLAALAAQGVAQPFHVADLDLWRPPVAAGLQVAAAAQLCARADGAAFGAFLDWAAEAADGKTGRAAILAAFASGALRAVHGDATPAVRVETPGATPGTYLDADHRGLAALTADPDASQPGLIVRDLCATRVHAMRMGTDTVPVLTLARGAGETLDLTLDSPGDALDAAGALTLLDGFAARLAEPLRHLL